MTQRTHTGMPLRRMGRISLILVSIAVVGCATRLSMADRQREVLDAYARQVPGVVDDETKAALLVQLGERVFEQLRVETAELETRVERFHALYRDYDASREGLEAALSAVQDQRRDIRELLLSARGEAVSLTSAQEWDAMVTREKTLISLAYEEGWLL